MRETKVASVTGINKNAPTPHIRIPLVLEKGHVHREQEKLEITGPKRSHLYIQLQDINHLESERIIPVWTSERYKHAKNEMSPKYR